MHEDIQRSISEYLASVFIIYKYEHVVTLEENYTVKQFLDFVNEHMERAGSEVQ